MSTLSINERHTNGQSPHGESANGQTVLNGRAQTCRFNNASCTGEASPVRVGIAGLGRSGWNIHAAALAAMPHQFRVVAVMDPCQERRDEATYALGCRAYKTSAELAGDEDVELIVVAGPSHLHAPQCIEALERGKHVVCEKPFGLGTAQADAIIAAAECSARVVTPFFNRRYEQHFQKVRAILASGQLGRIVQVRFAWHDFTRRWDWQTMREDGGGALYNNGSHLLDQALQIWNDLAGDKEPDVEAHLDRALTSGDAEDHLKVLLSALDAPLLDIELSSACAFPQDRWLVMGTHGGLRGSTEYLEWRQVEWDDLPERVLHRGPAPDRQYQRDEIIWHTGKVQCTDCFDDLAPQFYNDLFQSLCHNAPLPSTPQQARQLVQLIERVLQQTPRPATPAPRSNEQVLSPTTL